MTRPAFSSCQASADWLRRNNRNAQRRKNGFGARPTKTERTSCDKKGAFYLRKARLLKWTKNHDKPAIGLAKRPGPRKPKLSSAGIRRGGGHVGGPLSVRQRKRGAVAAAAPSNAPGSLPAFRAPATPSKTKKLLSKKAYTTAPRKSTRERKTLIPYNV